MSGQDLQKILLVFAFVLFVIGVFARQNPPNTPWYGRFNFISAGLAFWVLVEIMVRSRG